MKKKLMLLAFLGALSINVLADDGEMAGGGRAVEPPPTDTSSSMTAPSTDPSLADQVANYLASMFAGK